MDKFKVGIIGADSAVGRQLTRLLMGHPVVELTALSRSVPYTGTRQTHGIYGGVLAPVTDAKVAELADIVINADISADGQELAATAVSNKCVFIDMSPAFRLENAEEYEQWYSAKFTYPGLHEEAVYGLPELTRDSMAGKVLVSVPGAAATAVSLALVPALLEGLVSPEGITVSAYGMAAENDAPHTPDLRETPEIEQMLSLAAGKTVKVSFARGISHDTRGITVTCFAKTTLSGNARTIRSAYERLYANEPFVRVLKERETACAESVIGSNRCDISIRVDERTGMTIFTAALDGLMKGSAGQAVQCMNLILSMPESLAVDALPEI